MTRSAYVLYLEDPIAGPALELMRRVIQPGSRSLPHVTVMYVRDRIQDHGTGIYSEFAAEQLTLLGPGTFDASPSRRKRLSTLFIRCESLTLESLHHKPDFPDSFLHLSLHDGADAVEAAEAFQVLKKFPWNLDVTLPPTRLRRLTAETTESGVETLTSKAQKLLGRLTSGQVQEADLPALSNEQRQSLLEAISVDLHDLLPQAPDLGQRAGGKESHVVANRPIYQQEEFWPVFDFVDPDRAARLRNPDREAHRRSGVFLTPPEIAFDITRAAISHVPDGGEIHFGDPSIGSGIFLAALARLRGTDGIASAIGVEADRLRGHLTYERWRSLGLDVVTGDFVEGILGPEKGSPGVQERQPDRWPDSRRTLILANPPYVRSQRLDSGTKNHWQRALQLKRNLKIDARSDLFLYFVLAAHEWLRDGGTSAWLLPTEFMFTNYGAALRNYLIHEVTLHTVHTYDGPSKFSNARVSSCAVIFSKASPRGDHEVTFSAGGVISDPYAKLVVPVESLRGLDKWHFIADEGIDRPDTRGRTIGELFRVKRGVATGSNRHFVLDSETAMAMDAPRQWLQPVVPRARHLAEGVIEADTVGDPVLPGLHWLIDADEPIDVVRRKSPRLAKYLETIEAEVMTRTLVRRRTLFYRQEAHQAPRFVFSYMARDEAFGRRFFLNRSRAVILNNYLGLHPLPKVAEWLNESPHNEIALLGVLRSVAPSTLSRAGRVYVEGLTKVEPRELSAIRLEDLPPELEAVLSEAAE